MDNRVFLCYGEKNKGITSRVWCNGYLSTSIVLQDYTQISHPTLTFEQFRRILYILYVISNLLDFNAFV